MTSVVTDYPDWSPHVAHAEQIANTGVPLLALPQTVLANTAITPAPGSSYQSAVFGMNQVSYEIWVAVQFASGTPTPFVQVQLLWGEPANAVTIATDSWVLAGGQTAPGMVVRGRGPCKGSNVIVQVTNLDSTTTPTVQVRLITHSRPVAADDWRWNNHSNNLQTVPGFTLPFLPDDESVLGIFNSTVLPASGSANFLCGMFNTGLVQLAGKVTGPAASSVTLTVVSRPNTLFGGGAVLYQNPLAAVDFNITFLANRCPFLVQWTNASTTAGTIVAMAMGVPY